MHMETPSFAQQKEYKISILTSIISKIKIEVGTAISETEHVLLKSFERDLRNLHKTKQEA